MMKNTADQLEQIIVLYSEQLKQITENDFAAKPDAANWSRKEELGHLIDSAHTNLRRFVVAQYEVEPKIVYDQNFWNTALNYQHQPSSELISLWVLMNRQICQVLNLLKSETENRMCNTGKEKPELHSIEWLADDYCQHLLHHLHHLLSLEAIPY